MFAYWTSSFARAVGGRERTGSAELFFVRLNVSRTLIRKISPSVWTITPPRQFYCDYRIVYRFLVIQNSRVYVLVLSPIRTAYKLAVHDTDSCVPEGSKVLEIEHPKTRL